MGHRLRHVGLGRCGAGAQQLWGTGLIAWRHGGTFLEQGLDLCPLHWQEGS